MNSGKSISAYLEKNVTSSRDFVILFGAIKNKVCNILVTLSIAEKSLAKSKEHSFVFKRTKKNERSSFSTQDRK